MLFGRVIYEMMESAWRQPATGTWADWMDEWEIPFAETIDRAKKCVVSSALNGVEWNAELVREATWPKRFSSSSRSQAMACSWVA